jgi:hypothetical protein
MILTFSGLHLLFHITPVNFQKTINVYFRDVTTEKFLVRICDGGAESACLVAIGFAPVAPAVMSLYFILLQN